MDLRELKDKASQLFAKGKFSRAAEHYQEYCQADSKDLQSRLRLGDAWSKAGKRDKAVAAYIWAAEGFAKEGFLPRAIAATKLVLELDPGHTGVQKTLALLYARKSSTGMRVAKPPAAEPLVTRTSEPLGTASGFERRTDAIEIDFEDEVPPVEPAIEIEVVSAPGDPVSPELPAPPPTPVYDLEDVAEEPPPPVAPPPPVLAPTAPTFTELELDASDSLLHLVEAAGRAPAVEVPEPNDEVEEAPLEPGALPTIPLFSDLPPEAFVALFDGCPLHRLEDGHQVIEQGSHGDAFYVVCAGKVRVYRTEGQQRRELATLEEGAFFGEMALLSQAPRTASVETLGPDTQILEIPAAVLKTLSARHPSVARALKKFCRQRLLSNLMATAQLFRSFNRGDRRELIEKFRAREVGRGEVILAEGVRSDGLYVVLSGEVQVSRQGAPVASLREGELFGEMSLLTRAGATATVTASRHTSLLRLPKEDFDLLILSHPQILELVSNLTDERQRANEALDLV